MAIVLNGTTGITAPDIDVTAQSTDIITTGDVSAVDGTFSGGVYLGGTVAANYLDDYEEGEYEPTVAPGTSGTITVDGTNKIATYTKIGDLVTAHGRIDIASVSSPIGRVEVSLPFTVASGTGKAREGSVSLFIWNPSSGETGLFVGLFVEGGSSILILYGDNIGPSNGAEKMQAGSEIRFSVTYRTS